jgi:alkylated DNA repair dioxygenase AlkB
MADEPAITYTYARSTKIPRVWDPAIAAIRDALNVKFNTTFNSALIIKYHEGSKLDFHADNEKEIVKYTPIVSLSLGVARPITMKCNATNEEIKIPLEPGDLFAMEGRTQQHYKHAIKPFSQRQLTRIVITFRRLKTNYTVGTRYLRNQSTQSLDTDSLNTEQRRQRFNER